MDEDARTQQLLEHIRNQHRMFPHSECLGQLSLFDEYVHDELYQDIG